LAGRCGDWEDDVIMSYLLTPEGMWIYKERKKNIGILEFNSQAGKII
jgi:hypothetical protein